MVGIAVSPKPVAPAKVDVLVDLRGVLMACQTSTGLKTVGEHLRHVASAQANRQQGERPYMLAWHCSTAEAMCPPCAIHHSGRRPRLTISRFWLHMASKRQKAMQGLHGLQVMCSIKGMAGKCFQQRWLNARYRARYAHMEAPQMPLNKGSRSTFALLSPGLHQQPVQYLLVLHT